MNFDSCNHLSNLISQLNDKNYIGTPEPESYITDLFVTDEFSDKVIDQNDIEGVTRDVVNNIFRLGETCCSSDEVEKLVLFHQQLLQTKTEESELYRMNTAHALKFIIADLNRYPGLVANHRWQTLIEDLKFTKSLANQMDLAQDEEEVVKAVASRIYDKVQLLSQKEGPSSVIIPAGFKDHRIYNQIEWKENGYVFTTFNTGSYAYTIEDSLIAILQWNQIPREKLTRKFFEVIIAKNFEEGTDDLKMNSDVSNYLYSKELRNGACVRVQRTQAGDSCVTKALMSLFRYNLGTKEIYSYKAWLTETKIEWLKSIESKLQPAFYERELDFAQEALTRRKAKVLLYEPVPRIQVLSVLQGLFSATQSQISACLRNSPLGFILQL